MRVMLTGGLRVDLFEQSRYLANGISMKLRLHRQKDEFLLMAADNTFKIQVTEAFFDRTQSESESWGSAWTYRCTDERSSQVSYYKKKNVKF